MPTWGRILEEISAVNREADRLPPRVTGFDVVRRRYLAALATLTRRNVILYSTAFARTGTNRPLERLIPEDVQGFMEAVHGLNGTSVDLVLHAPVGSLEAAGAIASYLRSRFTDIRVLVPQLALSEATALACVGHRLCLGAHSSLGTVEPWVMLPGAQGAVRANAVLAEMRGAGDEARSEKDRAVWEARVDSWPPGLIAQSEAAIDAARRLITQLLSTGMLAGAPDAAARAARAAAILAPMGSSGQERWLSPQELREAGIIVEPLEADPALQDALLSVHHAATHTFGGTHARKIIENHLGTGFFGVELTPQADQG